MRKKGDIHILNPWVTSEYDRERERLFYLALQVNKEFILSSKACKHNLTNFTMMMKYKKNKNKKYVTYAEEDKIESYQHLINTILLLTPVISTTFASVGRFLESVKQPGSLGMLIIDEAGQALPYQALGALWRCNKAIVVGDPKQVEPVVTDELSAIKNLLKTDIIEKYEEKVFSVQTFADSINPFGSYIYDKEEDDNLWVGCPLLVHRRCIEPMFSISNNMVYSGNMIMKTMKEGLFLYEESLWLNICGSEVGNKNHYVKEQGNKALELIIESFEKYKWNPNIFVILPFTSVIKGFIECIKKSEELKIYGNKVNEWMGKSVGQFTSSKEKK